MSTTELMDIEAEVGRTEVANAKRFAAGFKNRCKWCEAYGSWLIELSGFYQRDTRRVAEGFAKLIADDIWGRIAAIASETNPTELAAMIRFARATASAKGVDAMLRLARSEGGMSVLPEQLDADPYLLNCANGVVNLKDGKLRPHDSRLLLTKITAAAYPTEAGEECPLWEESIQKIFGFDDELVGFVRRLLGASLIGKPVEAILPVFFGDGSNGKTVLVETMLDVLGSYAGTCAKEVLLGWSDNSHPCGLADLCGKRLVVASETEHGRALNESTVKLLTGNDRVKARFMRQDFFDFKPTHSLILVTNHKPVIRGTDTGIWRRVCLVPFVKRFWDASRGETGPAGWEADKRLRENLQPEHPAILKWLVAGCLEYQRDGLGLPATIKAATEDYRSAEDIIGTFFDQHVAWPVDGAVTTAAELRAEYEKWSKAIGEKPVSPRRFGEWLRLRGVQSKRSNGIRYINMALVR